MLKNACVVAGVFTAVVTALSPANAGLALNLEGDAFSDTPIIAVDKRQWNVITITPKVKRDGSDVNRLWRWKVEINRGVPGAWQHEVNAEYPIQKDRPESGERIKVPPGRHSVTVTVGFDDTKSCSGCKELSYTKEVDIERPHARTYAVIIGVSKYKRPDQTDTALRPRDLRFPDSDALQLYEVVTKVLGVDRNHVLLFTSNKGPNAQEPTKQNIEKLLLGLAETVGSEDIVLFFYSGHG